MILWSIVKKQLQETAVQQHEQYSYIVEQFKELPLLQETTQRQINLTLSPVSFHILSHPIMF